MVQDTNFQEKLEFLDYFLSAWLNWEVLPLLWFFPFCLSLSLSVVSITKQILKMVIINSWKTKLYMKGNWRILWDSPVYDHVYVDILTLTLDTVRTKNTVQVKRRWRACVLVCLVGGGSRGGVWGGGKKIKSHFSQ